MRILLLFCLSIFCVGSLHAQPLQNPFPFALPGLDSEATGHLGFDRTLEPADDRIRVRDGHFVNSADERQRFFGTSLFYSAIFPDSVDAVRMAETLHSLGFNAVRFVGFDFSYWNDASLFRPIQESARTELDEEQMRRFDWLVYQLKQHGIYIHMPLHNFRTARPEDNIRNWDTIPWQLRAVTFFDPDIQAAERRFIRMFLEHRNPYTGTAYKDETALAWLDIAEDKSLFDIWRNFGFAPNSFNGFSYYHSQLLHDQWNAYLRDKYETNAALRSAWSKNADVPGNLIASPGFEDEFSADWTLIAGEQTEVRADPFSTDRQEGEFAMRVRINQGGAGLGDIQLRNSSIPIQKDRLYTLRFHAKTDEAAGRQIAVHLMNGNPPYEAYGLFFRVTAVSDEWQEYSYTFRSTGDNEFGALFIIFCGGEDGDLFVDNFDLRMLDEAGLQANESLADGTVAFAPAGDLTGFPVERIRDNSRFLQELVDSYYGSIYMLVKDTLNCEALIGTPQRSNTLNDVYATRNLDYTAMNTGWDWVSNANSESWFILNIPMLRDVNVGNLAVTARTAIAGKPHVVTRAVTPFPSASQNEMMTLWPAYAAYQDWDAIYAGVYATNRNTMNADSIVYWEHWEFKNNPALLAMVPAAAHAFRKALIRPAEATIAIEQTQEALLYPPRQQGSYWLESNSDNRLPLFRRVEIRDFDAEFQTAFPQRDIFELAAAENLNTSAMQSDTEELVWNADDELFTVNTDRYLAVQGSLQGRLLELGDIFISRLDEGDIGSISWLSQDDQPLAEAGRSLITLSSRALNRGALWTNNNQSLGAQWGSAPVEMEAMRVEVAFESTFDTLIVEALDARGVPLTDAVQSVTNNNGRFRFILDQNLAPAVWYRLRQIRAQTTDVAEKGADEQPVLSLPRPNPARSFADVDVNVPNAKGALRLELYSALGQKTHSLWQRTIDDGMTTVRIPTGELPAGLYLLRMTGRTTSASRYLTVIH